MPNDTFFLFKSKTKKNELMISIPGQNNSMPTSRTAKIFSKIRFRKNNWISNISVFNIQDKNKLIHVYVECSKIENACVHIFTD